VRRRMSVGLSVSVSVSVSVNVSVRVSVRVRRRAWLLLHASSRTPIALHQPPSPAATGSAAARLCHRLAGRAADRRTAASRACTSTQYRQQTVSECKWRKGRQALYESECRVTSRRANRIL
jgi:hypothetical protein